MVETRKEREENGGEFGQVDQMIMAEVQQYGDKNVLDYYGDKQGMSKPKQKKPKAKKPIKNHLGMKLSSGGKKGRVELAVNKIKGNSNLAQRYQGPQNFMDLADYGDKFEAQIDQYNDKVAITGGPPKNICNKFFL